LKEVSDTACSRSVNDQTISSSVVPSNGARAQSYGVVDECRRDLSAATLPAEEWLASETGEQGLFALHGAADRHLRLMA